MTDHAPMPEPAVDFDAAVADYHRAAIVLADAACAEALRICANHLPDAATVTFQGDWVELDRFSIDLVTVDGVDLADIDLGDLDDTPDVLTRLEDDLHDALFWLGTLEPDQWDHQVTCDLPGRAQSDGGHAPEASP